MEFCKHTLIMLHIPTLLHDFKDKRQKEYLYLKNYLPNLQLGAIHWTLHDMPSHSMT